MPGFRLLGVDTLKQFVRGAIERDVKNAMHSDTSNQPKILSELLFKSHSSRNEGAQMVQIIIDQIIQYDYPQNTNVVKFLRNLLNERPIESYDFSFSEIAHYFKSANAGGVFKMVLANLPGDTDLSTSISTKIIRKNDGIN